MANEIAGKGIRFRRWDGAGSWVTIAGISNISGPSSTRDTYDTTAFDTTGGYRTFIGGLRDGGTVSLTMFFQRAEYELFKTDFESDVLQDYEIILPDAENSSFTFEGLVTENNAEMPVDNVITSTVSIKISGVISSESGSGPSPG